MAFLTKRDYFLLIDEEDLDVVTFSGSEGTTAENIIEETEANVIQEISSYLSGRYDVSKIFFPVFEYLAGETFKKGDFIYLNAPKITSGINYSVGSLVAKENLKVYKCTTAGTSATGEFIEIGLDGAYYTALVDTNASDLFSDATKFETGEKRNALMKRHVINIALYELHSRINPRNIPEFRIQRRDDSVSWLKMVQNPRNNVDADFLPKRDLGQQKGNDISWNSKNKLSHDY
jgi:phage gp36-like protein